MALIKCPECKNDISDRAEICIHCGFPIKEILEKNIYNESKLFDIIFIKSACEKESKAWLKRLFKRHGDSSIKFKDDFYKNGETILYGFSRKSADWICNKGKEFGKCILSIKESVCTEESSVSQSIIKMLNEREQFEDIKHYLEEEKNQPVICPRCGSSHISTGQRGYSLFWGFLGSNQTVNRCAKCGHSWKP